MPQRNGYKSHRGRSAIARKTEFGGASGTNGIMPTVYVKDQKGVIIKTNYFGGVKKGGAAPSATGFNRVGNTNQPAAPALNKNYFFNFKEKYSLGYPGAGGPLL